MLTKVAHNGLQVGVHQTAFIVKVKVKGNVIRTFFGFHENNYQCDSW